MSAPEKCPKCGAEKHGRSALIVHYECGSMFAADGGPFKSESKQCIQAQRDQLAERVKRLEAVGDIMATAYEEILFDNHDARILENYRKVRSEKGHS